MARFSAMKVPDEARKGNEDNFMPSYVSIGPLHAHKNPQFKAMEDIKTKYVKSFLKRADPEKPPMKEQEICGLLRTKASWSASYFYAEEVTDGIREDFTQMLMRDGCFIIEFFLWQTESKEGEAVFIEIDPNYKIETKAIMKDLLLLENQLPWEVLELLFDGICKKTEINLENLAFTSFQRLTPCKQMRPPSPPGTGKNISSSIKKLHLLDCFRHYLLGSKARNFDTGSRPVDPKFLNVPSVAELVEVKVKFTAILKSRYMADITFAEQGEMKIPQICVDTYTEHLFRNLLAFERGDPNVPSLFTSYIVLLKYLIKTKEDAEHLQKTNVLTYYTSSENLVSFFHSLYIDTSFRSILYTGLRGDLNKFYNARWNKWHAALIRNYCNNPWMIIATVGAFVIAGLTVVQTIYTILGYHEP
ncbi:hypothetical protein CJ030_MR4G020984 [Morella rubra]|uniref:Uncharacterized protein n=1 Tax=Morella rubra TaxID=262757 RepID=A0A6A1VZP0_9ROSI|nr:hypothetical protein CJ030_MR4G020984 [Morella rubra]